MLWVRVLHFTSSIGPTVAFFVAEMRKKREKLLKNVAKCMEHKIPLLININCFFNALNVLWYFKRAQCGGQFFSVAVSFWPLQKETAQFTFSIGSVH